MYLFLLATSTKEKAVGLGPGSSSQYSMYWLRHMPVHWTRTVHWYTGPGPSPRKHSTTQHRKNNEENENGKIQKEKKRKNRPL